MGRGKRKHEFGGFNRIKTKRGLKAKGKAHSFLCAHSKTSLFAKYLFSFVVSA